MKHIFAFLAALFAFFTSAANAALPVGVDTAITAAGTDAAAAGGLVLVAIAGIFVIGLIRRVLR